MAGVELNKYRDIVRPLRSDVSGRLPDPTQMDPGELFVNVTDRLLALRDESKQVLNMIAGLEPEYRDLLVNNEIFLPKSGVVDNITYNTAFHKVKPLDGVINITDTSPSVISIEDISEDITINFSAVEDVTNKIVKIFIEKTEKTTNDVAITWNNVGMWLSDDNAAPRWGVGGTDSYLIVAVFITSHIVVCNTIYNTENPVMSGSAFINWGQIRGEVSDQKDLQNILDSKADLAYSNEKFVTKVNAQITDKLTIGV